VKPSSLPTSAIGDAIACDSSASDKVFRNAAARPTSAGLTSGEKVTALSLSAQIRPGGDRAAPSSVVYRNLLALLGRRRQSKSHGNRPSCLPSGSSRALRLRESRSTCDVERRLGGLGITAGITAFILAVGMTSHTPSRRRHRQSGGVHESATEGARWRQSLPPAPASRPSAARTASRRSAKDRCRKRCRWPDYLSETSRRAVGECGPRYQPYGIGKTLPAIRLGSVGSRPTFQRLRRACSASDRARFANLRNAGCKCGNT